MAEEAALSVVEGLQADDWKRVRDFSGKSLFSTYIRVVTVRLLEDFARKRFGRMRPPLWVKALGGVWERLFELLCLRRLSVHEAVEITAQRELEEQREIEDSAYTLLAKIPNCGKHQGLELVSQEIDDVVGAEITTVARSFEQKQKEELFTAVVEVVLGSPGIGVSGKFLDKFNELDINLSSDEKLLLRLCYQEDMSVTGAGKMIGMTRFQAHGKMRRLMKRLHEEFSRVGLARELRQYL